MLSVARDRPPPPGAPAPQYAEGDALAMPFPDASFDAAASTQVYEYVEDMAAALAEARRVLRPGGRLLVLDTDWDSIVPEADAWALDLTTLGRDYFFSLCRYLFLALA
jgi:arsenite methyltransferase